MAEAYALVASKDTLSSTWVWLRDSLPFWGSVFMSASLSAALIWLLTVHWVFNVFDRPGFDWTEKVVIIVGFVWGAIGAVMVRRHKEVDEPED